MNDEERNSERHREMAELLETARDAILKIEDCLTHELVPLIERIVRDYPPPPPSRLTRCCPICLGTWEGGIDAPCPRCGGKFAPTTAGGSASCTCGTDDGTCNPKTP